MKNDQKREIGLMFSMLVTIASAVFAVRNTFSFLFVDSKFFIDALIGWFLTVSFGGVTWRLRPGQPTPDTHIMCPDCKELILKEAKVCKHCGCKLIPQV